MKNLCILGATGSIGVSTLDVVSRHPDQFNVVALTANKNVDQLFDQCLKHRPDYAVVVDTDKAERFAQRIKSSTVSHITVLTGSEALEKVASLPQCDFVMAAIVGAAGLLPTLAAARSGKRILLANKEALVMSGPLFMDEVSRAGAELLPIDSEHNAIFQCMPPGYRAGSNAKEVSRILLTASGGPFRTLALDKLPDVTPEQAVAHPNWDMGKKISVDSATMMNKGLELIEASLLYNLPPEKIEVVIHPQSVIHSMVDYVDGTILAQMGNPDMRIPIAHAMAWPERFDSGVEPLDIFAVGRLDFEKPDFLRFPCLNLAFQAINQRGVMPAILNAANEIAVEAFLEGNIRFTDIAPVIKDSMENITNSPADTLEHVLVADKTARNTAMEFIQQRL